MTTVETIASEEQKRRLDRAAGATRSRGAHAGRRGRKRGRSSDAPLSPKTRKRKASTISDGEWLPGTWPAGHGGGGHTGSAGSGVGVMETEQLIAEIERRPGIYDSGCPQYQDRVAKWTLWCEVCEVMTPRWHVMDEDRKAARVKELQKRWKSLRDSFMKELKLQREIQRTGQTANRKKYVFFDQMTFLMPCLEARGNSRSSMTMKEDPYESETDSSKAEPNADQNDCGEDAPVNLSTANGSGLGSLGGTLGGSLGGSLGAGLGGSLSLGTLAQLSTPAEESQQLLQSGFPERKYRADWKRRRTTYDEDEDDPDGDRLFLLSLVPSLRSLRGAAKSALKIELAQLVHKTLYEPDDALADSMTESLAPVVSLAEGSPASSTQSECTVCGTGNACKCSYRQRLPRRGGANKHFGVDYSNFNGHSSGKVHGI